MRLKQNEYCHNCDKYVDFEFEDTTSRQVIICPSCGHQHWREIDMDTLIRIRTNMYVPEGARELRIAKMPELPCLVNDLDDICYETIKVDIEVKKVVGRTEKGEAIIEEEDPNGGRHAKISNRRWGRDPNQGF